jgi:hypothetical protein
MNKISIFWSQIFFLTTRVMFLCSKVRDYSRTRHLAGALLLWVSVRITCGWAPFHCYYSTPQRCRQSLPVCVGTCPAVADIVLVFFPLRKHFRFGIDFSQHWMLFTNLEPSGQHWMLHALIFLCDILWRFKAILLFFSFFFLNCRYPEQVMHTLTNLLIF